MNSRSSNSEGAEFITLARVVKTQGRWGEVAAEIHTDVPERFAEGMRLFALPVNTDKRANVPTMDIRREVQVESLWPHKEWVILKFAGVDSISDAEALIGCELQIPRSERAQLDPGWNYVSDLVGCSVFDHDIEIGRIEDVRFGAGQAPLLIVANAAGKKFDVPFADAYLENVDTGRRRLRMRLPEGLLDVNAPLTAEEKAEQARLQREVATKQGSGKSATRSSRRARH